MLLKLRQSRKRKLLHVAFVIVLGLCSNLQSSQVFIMLKMKNLFLSVVNLLIKISIQIYVELGTLACTVSLNRVHACRSRYSIQELSSCSSLCGVSYATAVM